MALRAGVALGAGLVACSSSTTSSPATPDAPTAGDPTMPTGAAADAGPNSPTDAGPDAFVPTGKCASAFGNTLTTGFGRIDGVVYAVQKPSDTQCTMPNSDHVVVQVLMNGAVYRMVANVSASAQNPTIRVSSLSHALPAPAFGEGWHASVPFDYVTTLGRHSTDFSSQPMNAAVTTIVTALKVGDPVAVYATVGAGRPESAHLVHRNVANQDGAIVVHPTGASPTFLLFSFDDQTF